MDCPDGAPRHIFQLELLLRRPLTTPSPAGTPRPTTDTPLAFMPGYECTMFDTIQDALDDVCMLNLTPEGSADPLLS